MPLEKLSTGENVFVVQVVVIGSILNLFLFATFTLNVP